MPASQRLGISTDAGDCFCCYGCYIAQKVTSFHDGSSDKILWPLARLGIAVFMAMNVMGFALSMHASSIYPEYALGLNAEGSALDGLMRYFLLLLSAPVLLLLAPALIDSAVMEIRHARPGVNSIIALGVIASLLLSIRSTYIGQGPLYYDVTTMVLAFYSLGRYMDAHYRLKASQRLENLFNKVVSDQKVQKLEEDGRVSSVTASQLQVGERFLLQCGQALAVDAKIVEGEGVFDNSTLTGESSPVYRGYLEELPASSVLVEGFLVCEVQRNASESWLGRMQRLVDEARASKLNIEDAAAKISVIFSWVVMSACLCALWVGARQGWQEAVMRLLSTALVSCPCALGAAVPLGYWRSFEKILVRGIVFRDLAKFEALNRVKAVFFDKTGTLTESFPKVKYVQWFGDQDQARVLSQAASLASYSTHPLSKAIAREYLKDNRLEGMTQVQTRVGGGLSAQYQSAKILLGAKSYLQENNVSVAQYPESFSEAPLTSVFFAENGSLKAVFYLEHRTRRGAQAAIDFFKNAGIQTSVLTGDTKEASSALSRALGVEVLSAMTPEQKMRYIQDWQKKNHAAAAAVGEGLNDAPALGGAAVSIAIDSALDKTKNEADFVLPDDDLEKIAWLFELSKSTRARVMRNLFWAFFYNLCLLPAAVMGYLNPISASLAMILSGSFVVVSSMRKA